jgi:hypothetical protein
MLPTPAAVNPVIVPDEADAVQAKVLPAILAVGVKVAVPPEHIVWVSTKFVTVG